MDHGQIMRSKTGGLGHQQAEVCTRDCLCYQASATRRAVDNHQAGVLFSQKCLDEGDSFTLTDVENPIFERNRPMSAVAYNTQWLCYLREGTPRTQCRAKTAAVADLVEDQELLAD